MAVRNKHSITFVGKTLEADFIIAEYRKRKDTLDLKERHRAMFEARFGINDGIIKTNKETGRMFGVCGQRVWQISALVLDRMGLLGEEE